MGDEPTDLPSSAIDSLVFVGGYRLAICVSGHGASPAVCLS